MLIDLHIEELILRNLPYEQRHRIAAAVEQELQRLLTERGLPPTLAQGGTIPLLRIDPLTIAADARPGAIGAHIAENMYALLADTNRAVEQEKGA
ncbi:MAG TPA: hypothetical protein VL485_02460 [Ktedonobacteraceae bacterium]|jgi:hypothetical protein|nr:hypothetical protein [Ktedonobacteraceae bacterium]